MTAPLICGACYGLLCFVLGGLYGLRLNVTLPARWLAWADAVIAHRKQLATPPGCIAATDLDGLGEN